MMRGCPEERANVAPQMRPDTRHSMVAMRFPVAWPRRPPRATMGARAAKYMKNKAERHWGLKWVRSDR